MSGLLAVYRPEATAVSLPELQAMAAPLARHGPDGTALWRDGCVGLGLTLLATTPELLAEAQPVVHAATGCAVVADVRLDNRAELLAALGLSDQAAALGDAGLLLAAYLAWGEGCVARLLGDFAFALWDPRRQALLAARDPFGMRPFYYYHAAGRLFACASSPRGLLALPDVPRRVNPARIADFLVMQLEGVDKTSTFFTDIYRLPPAHGLLATPAGLRIWRYWAPEPQPPLRLPSDAAYAEAFLAVFTAAVSSRLRSVGPVGATLSGGIDSASVVAVARTLLARAGQGPLRTFSAVGPDPAACPETRAIHAALTMGELQPHLVNHADLQPWLPELADLSWDLDEPFDNAMALPRAVYLSAHRQGIRVVLDGGGGDIVLSEGNALARLLRRGHGLSAYRHAVGLRRFYRGRYPVGRELWRSARLAFTPSFLRRARRRLWPPNMEKRVAANLHTSLLSPEFARRVNLAERLRLLDSYGATERLLSAGEELARALDHPYVAAGRERFWRTAAAMAIEPRDPFLDRRLVDFALALPDEQRAGSGWPKAILRRALAGRLPEAVRWRIGKEHLGWTFTLALLALVHDRLKLELCTDLAIMGDCVMQPKLDAAVRAYLQDNDLSQAETVFDAAQLAVWLRRYGAAR